jgi:hypothetical protein
MKGGSKSAWLNKASEDKKKWQKRWVELQGHQLTYTSKQVRERGSFGLVFSKLKKKPCHRASLPRGCLTCTAF